MKTLIRVLCWTAFVIIIGWALKYISAPENSINLRDGDWGIFHDNPLKMRMK